MGFKLNMLLTPEEIKRCDQAYERTKRKALEHGIPHHKDCKYVDRNIPIDACACDCEERWWFRQAIRQSRNVVERK